MKRIFTLLLLLNFSMPAHSHIETVQFEGLFFPIAPTWSNLTITSFGFGLNIDKVNRPTGPGTLSASSLNPDDYIIELENGEEISTVTLLKNFLQGHHVTDVASNIASAISAGFPSVSQLKRDDLVIFLEEEPYLPNQFKAYIIPKNRDIVEISATMDRRGFSNYLMKIQPTE